MQRPKIKLWNSFTSTAINVYLSYQLFIEPWLYVLIMIVKYCQVTTNKWVTEWPDYAEKHISNLKNISVNFFSPNFQDFAWTLCFFTSFLSCLSLWPVCFHSPLSSYPLSYRLQVPGCVTPAPSLSSPAPGLSSPAPPASSGVLLW